MIISISGTIQETSVFDIPDPRGRRVIVDPHEVERINSMGVRAWIGFMTSLIERSPEVVVRRLPPVLVSQASMITSFLAGARVESFMSPWYCPNCEHTLEQQHAFTDPVPEALACPKCQSPMELDDDREAYMAFREAV